MDALDPAGPDETTLDIASDAPRLEAGSPQPLGANWTGRGTNFAVVSAHADRVELCLFDAAGVALTESICSALAPAATAGAILTNRADHLVAWEDGARLDR